MEFIEVSKIDSFRTDKIYQSYCKTFPEDERRNENQFRMLFSNPKVRFYMVLDELDDVGYLILWELTSFVFVEHFEIFSEFRSRKYGTEIIQYLCRNYTHIILEAEPESVSDDAKRRISFYTKNGFTVIDETYVQPCYEPGKNPLNLWLLANWQPEKTSLILDELYDVVYC